MRRQRRNKGRAQGLVEFALVLPVFLLILFGIFDAGRLIVTYNALANSARAGARVAIVNQSPAGSTTCDTTSATAWPKGCAIASGTGANVQEADVDVQIRNSTDSDECRTDTGDPTVKIGCIAVVRVDGRFEALTPIIGQILGPIDLSSTTKIPIERVCSNPTPAPLANC